MERKDPGREQRMYWLMFDGKEFNGLNHKGGKLNRVGGSVRNQTQGYYLRTVGKEIQTLGIKGIGRNKYRVGHKSAEREEIVGTTGRV